MLRQVLQVCYWMLGPLKPKKNEVVKLSLVATLDEFNLAMCTYEAEITEIKIKGDVIQGYVIWPYCIFMIRVCSYYLRAIIRCVSLVEILSLGYITYVDA